MAQGSFEHPDWSREVYYSPSESSLPSVAWRPPKVTDMPSWRDAKRIGIDVEVRDPHLKTLGPGVRRDPRENYVVGIGFSIEDGATHYLPIRHHGGDNCDWNVWEYIRSELKHFSGTLIGSNLPYDVDWVANEAPGILDPRIKLMDVQVSGVLINENEDAYDLESLCRRSELPGKDETILRQAAAAYRVHPKTGIWRMAGRFAAEYCMTDARRPHQVMRRQERQIESEGVQSIWGLEQKVTPLLVKMRRRGIRVDMDKVERIERQALHIATEEMAAVSAMSGVRVTEGDVWKTEALARALRAVGIEVPKTQPTLNKKTGKVSKGGGDSIDKFFLPKCGEIGRRIMRAREWSKLRTTYCKTVREHAIRSGDGEWRVHCSFNQTRGSDDSDDDGGRGVRYGRFSSTDYNLQAQPTRNEEFGALWRSVYMADRGARWACSDWSQQEPRIGVHYAELLKLPGAKEFADEYRKNPRLDIHQKLADISDMPRKIVKNTVNGRLYGMGDPKLCREIGCATVMRMVRGEWREFAGPEGLAKIAQFDKFAPWVRGLVREATKAAEETGCVWTWLRRKCRFRRGPDGKIWRAHKAFNRVGQGTAADQMKATLVAAEAEGIPVQMVVHDEFDTSFSDITQMRRLKQLQMETVKFSVPMQVDLEIGDNWGELQKDEKGMAA